MIIAKDHPDYDMEVALIHDQDDLLYIIHDKPFTNTLSWVEYDIETGMLNFIMDDGALQDFGIPISSQYKDNLSVMPEIAIAYLNKGEFQSGFEYPLIVHK